MKNKIGDIRSDEFGLYIIEEARKAIYAIRRKYGCRFIDDDDVIQNVVVYIYRYIHRYDKHLSALSTFIYVMIRSAVMDRRNFVNDKDMFNPKSKKYYSIWDLVGGYELHNCAKREILMEEILGSDYDVIYENELKDFIEYLYDVFIYYGNRFSNRVFRVYTLMVLNYNKKYVADKMGITEIRLNQMLNEIKVMPEFMEFCNGGKIR